jgi:tetratricopeptide (TPR) repeat protein
MTIHLRKIFHTSLLLILACLLLNGCARQYRPPEPAGGGQKQTIRPVPEQKSETIEEDQTSPGQEEVIGPELKPQKGPAHTLFREAEESIQKGDYKRAEILLERALRVEPRNGWYYHVMGRVRYAQGSYEQAIQFCLKSDSMAGGDSDLKRNNRLLLKKASGKTGDTRYK